MPVLPKLPMPKKARTDHVDFDKWRREGAAIEVIDLREPDEDWKILTNCQPQVETKPRLCSEGIEVSLHGINKNLVHGEDWWYLSCADLRQITISCSRNLQSVAAITTSGIIEILKQRGAVLIEIAYDVYHPLWNRKVTVIRASARRGIGAAPTWIEKRPPHGATPRNMFAVSTTSTACTTST